MKICYLFKYKYFNDFICIVFYFCIIDKVVYNKFLIINKKEWCRYLGKVCIYFSINLIILKCFFIYFLFNLLEIELICFFL